MSEEKKKIQEIVCHNCGARWRLPEGIQEIIAELIECPLCMIPEKEE